MSGSPKSVLGQEMVDRIISWLEFRQRLWDEEATGEYPAAEQWHWSDDEAAGIVCAIATMFEIEPKEIEDEQEGL